MADWKTLCAGASHEATQVWRWRAGSGTLWAAAACCCSTRALFLARKGGSSGFTWRTPAHTSTSSMWVGIEFLVHHTAAPTLPLSNGHCWSAGGGVEGGVEEEKRRRRRQYSLSQTQHTHSHTHFFIARDTLRYGELSLPTSVDPGLPLWKPLGWWSGLAAVEMSRTL